MAGRGRGDVVRGRAIRLLRAARPAAVAGTFVIARDKRRLTVSYNRSRAENQQRNATQHGTATDVHDGLIAEAFGVLFRAAELRPRIHTLLLNYRWHTKPNQQRVVRLQKQIRRCVEIKTNKSKPNIVTLIEISKSKTRNAH